MPYKIIIDDEYTGYEDHITQIIRGAFPRIHTEIASIGKSSPAHHVAYRIVKRTNKKTTVASVIEVDTAAALHPDFRRDQQPAHGLFEKDYTTQWIEAQQIGRASCRERV